MSPIADETILVTGGTGFIGGMVMQELLNTTSATIVALIRAPDDAGANARLARMLDGCLPPCARGEASSRIVAVAADLEQPDLGLTPCAHDMLAEEVTHIVHAAASVRFDLPLAAARGINVEGTRSVTALARRALRHGRLRRFVAVGTAFVAGTYAGVFDERQLDVGQKFRNTYESTKFEAETLLRRLMGELPITVVRPSIVMGHSLTGATTSFNVMYVPIRLFASGRVRRYPVRARMPIDVVPVDYVAKVIREATVGASRDGATYAAVAGRDAVTAAEVAEIAADVFAVGRPKLLPAALPAPAVSGLARLHARHQSRPRREALRMYLPYLAHGSRFDDSNTRELLGTTDVHRPDMHAYLRRVMEFARATSFGRLRRAPDGEAALPVPVSARALAVS